MKIATRASGWPIPVDHHLRPCTTISSPSMRICARMLVASEDATSGSVMQNTERISPSRSGRSQQRFCASLP
ncbi:hypothetical protein D3C71_1963080 [compost metagenome]